MPTVPLPSIITYHLPFIVGALTPNRLKYIPTTADSLYKLLQAVKHTVKHIVMMHIVKHTVKHIVMMHTVKHIVMMHIVKHTVMMHTVMMHTVMMHTVMMH